MYHMIHNIDVISHAQNLVFEQCELVICVPQREVPWEKSTGGRGRSRLTRLTGVMTCKPFCRTHISGHHFQSTVELYEAGLCTIRERDKQRGNILL